MPRGEVSYARRVSAKRVGLLDMDVIPRLTHVGNTLSAKFSISEKISFLHGQQELGRHIFPMRQMFFDGSGNVECDCAGRGHCPGPGKHPAILWADPWDPFSDWSRKAVVNHVSRKLSQGYGLHVGHSGLCVLDIDARHGGIDTLRELCAKHHVDVPEYTTCSSAGGGHVYFDAPVHAQSVRGFIGTNRASRCAVVLGPGVEIFFGQHLVLLPFSPHKTGCWYTVGPNQETVPLPQWLLDLVLSKDVFKVAAKQNRIWTIHKGRLHTISDNSSVSRARAYIAAIPGAISGQGGSAVTSRVASLLLVDFGLNYGDAYQLLAEWNQKCDPPWTDGELHLKMTWAGKRPGQRGWKNTPRSRPLTAEDKELNALDGARVRVLFERYILNVTDGTIFIREYLPVDNTSDIPDVMVPPGEAAAAPERLPLTTDKVDDGPRCNCYFSMLMRHAIKNMFRLMRLPRRRWDCPRCGPTRRKHLRDTHEVRIREWAANLPEGEEPNIYTWWIENHERPKTVRSIRRRKGKFFRLDPYGRGGIRGSRFLIVSTVSLPGVSVVVNDPESAIAALNAIVDAWPDDLKIRVWWSSWSWKLLPDEERSQGNWKRVGRIKCTVTEQRRILEKWNVDLQYVSSNGGRYGWWAEQGKFRADQWEAIKEDLELGEYTGGATWNNVRLIIPSEETVKYEVPVISSA